MWGIWRYDDVRACSDCVGLHCYFGGLGSQIVNRRCLCGPGILRWMNGPVHELESAGNSKGRVSASRAWLAPARVRLSSEPLQVSRYEEWQLRRHPVSARGLRICSHRWWIDDSICIDALIESSRSTGSWHDRAFDDKHSCLLGFVGRINADGVRIRVADIELNHAVPGPLGSRSDICRGEPAAQGITVQVAEVVGSEWRGDVVGSEHWELIGEAREAFGTLAGSLPVRLRRGPSFRHSVVGRGCAVGSGHFVSVHHEPSGHDRRCLTQWRGWVRRGRWRLAHGVVGARRRSAGSLRRATSRGVRSRSVARCNVVNANLVCNWRRRFGERGGFVPVVVEPDRLPPPPVAGLAAAPATGRMEIALTDGSRVIVDREVDGKALGRVLAALARG